jgi:hypothetical protein
VGVMKCLSMVNPAGKKTGARNAAAAFTAAAASALVLGAGAAGINKSFAQSSVGFTA